MGRRGIEWLLSWYAGFDWRDLGSHPSEGPPGSYQVLELTAGLVAISIAFTPDLRNWGTLLGPLGTLMSPWLAG
jgi:hypothetical protein